MVEWGEVPTDALVGLVKASQKHQRAGCHGSWLEFVKVGLASCCPHRHAATTNARAQPHARLAVCRTSACSVAAWQRGTLLLVRPAIAGTRAQGLWHGPGAAVARGGLCVRRGCWPAAAAAAAAAGHPCCTHPGSRRSRRAFVHPPHRKLCGGSSWRWRPRRAPHRHVPPGAAHPQVLQAFAESILSPPEGTPAGEGGAFIFVNKYLNYARTVREVRTASLCRPFGPHVSQGPTPPQ